MRFFVVATETLANQSKLLYNRIVPTHQFHMNLDFLLSILGNKLAIFGITILVGILVARMIYDMMSTHDRKKRPLMVASVANVSLLAMIWASEFAFQKSGWLPSALAWLPQQWYLPASIVLIIVALIRRHPSSAWLNAIAARFVAGVLMGPHFTPPAALAKSESMSVLTLDVEHWTAGAKPVVYVVSAQKPTVICLQNSGADGAGKKALADLEKKLTSYHFVHDGQMTVASTDPIDRVESAVLRHGPDDCPALVTAVHGKYL